jgi:putative membrane-bound dehydrogenase-like protein
MPRRLLALVLVALAAPAFAQLPPDKALASMKPGDGLQVELFAAEPMLINPTAIDVDHLGRVWVAEAVNYRCRLRRVPLNRKEGDRIVVLIDEKGEGKATKAVTFYQGPEVFGPLSVCVIPTGKSLRVLVAQSPDILEFTCKDASNPVADGPPKVFLTGFGGFDHDHGVHGLHLGPDGKLYFTVGDQGVGQGKDKDGKPIPPLQSADGKGRAWKSNNTDCQGGTVWRCDLDGKNLELIAHNFRNNYEACVDSFGEIWLSDNDDDGNQQTRICFVFPGGNYGYFPRGPGQTHWHEEQPGIVHKTLRTGFGSPTGIQFYEGNLLPKQYYNTLMHADAGPREIRAFTRKPKGAGYELDKALMLTSTDNWFRPSDVCTAPDGSVFVADWYDPGVGGHGMGDTTRGRIYRLTPTGHKGYKVPAVKLDTKEGVLAALGSPNMTVRQMGLKALDRYAGQEIMPVIDDPNTNAWVRARLLWRDPWYVPTGGVHCYDALEKSGDSATRTLAVRSLLADRFTWDASARFRMSDGKSASYLADPAVRREILIGLQKDQKPDSSLFYELAKQYDGSDLFYRAALNIACGTDPARRDAILADFDKHFPEWNDKVADLVWELRPKSMLPKLDALLKDAKLTGAQKARIVDILAASDDPAAGKTMLGLLKGDASAEVKQRALDNLKLFLPTKWKQLNTRDELNPAIDRLLADKQGVTAGLRLIALSDNVWRVDEVAAIAQDPKADPGVRQEAVLTLGGLRSEKAVAALVQVGVPENPLSAAAVQALARHLPNGNVRPHHQEAALAAVIQWFEAEKVSDEFRGACLKALAGSRQGTTWLLRRQADGKLPSNAVPEAGRLLRNSPFADLRNKALVLFPAAGKLDPKTLPPISELAKKAGSAANGKQLMAKSLTGEAQCLKCHMIRGTGGSIGPDLSMIGKKGSKENLYDSLLTPSKAIADQYVSWRIDSEDGQSIVGLLVEETAKSITVRDANGKDYTFAAKDVTKKKDPKSIMPEDVIKAFTEDELIDVVEYLMTLQTPSLTPDSWQVAGPFPAADDAALDREFDTKSATWKTIRGGANGYFDLAAFHGDKAPKSLSYLRRTIESPADQEVTIRLGTDDGCRLLVNGEKVLAHERHEAASPDRDQVKVKLKKGANEVLLKINNGDNPHGFYLTVEGGVDLKVK